MSFQDAMRATRGMLIKALRVLSYGKSATVRTSPEMILIKHALTSCYSDSLLSTQCSSIERSLAGRLSGLLCLPQEPVLAVAVFGNVTRL